MLASGCAIFLFGLPGIAVLQSLGAWRRARRMPPLGVLLMAPALGLGTFGPLSLLCAAAFKFFPVTVSGCWLLFTAGMWLLASRRPIGSTLEDLEAPPVFVGDVAIAPGILIVFGAALAALVPTINIYPWIFHGGLYVSAPIADHVKVALTDAIAREGLPLRNPFYAPGGVRILLSYSYGWYVMAAEVKRLGHATGWQAEVAMTWYTSFATICFLSSLACSLSGKAMAGFWVVMLFLSGPLTADLLPMMLGQHWLALIGLPASHGLEVPWVQLEWAPQHAYAGLVVVVLIWLMSALLAMPRARWRYVLVIGLMAAAGFEASCWVGGVALIGASPLLIAALIVLRLPWRHYVNLSKVMTLAVLLCVVCTLPLLKALLSGTGSFHDSPPVGIAVFPSTLLEDHLGLSGHAKLAARIGLYWLHLLPLSFGVVYLIGLPAMVLWMPRSPGQRTLRAMALATTIGFLLVSQFIASTIRANDLGWRAVTVPSMLLMVWAAAALTSLLDRSMSALAKWNISAGMQKFRHIAAAATIGVLALGLLSTVRANTQRLTFSAENIEEHRLFAQQARAWAVVRRYMTPTDLVECNPDGFSTVTPWPINLPYHLLSDRPTAYACIGTAKSYAFRYPWKANMHQYLLVKDAFSAKPGPRTIRALREQLHVKAILVTPADAVWASKAIEKSGCYRCVERTAGYRVYIAIKSPKK